MSSSFTPRCCGTARRSYKSGFSARDAFPNSKYQRVSGVVPIDGVSIPFTIECWADCQQAERGHGSVEVGHVLVNRSPSLGRLFGSSDAAGLTLRGCTLDAHVKQAKTAHYWLTLSLITPKLRISGDGKTPVLVDFRSAISQAVKKAASAVTYDGEHLRAAVTH